MKGAGDLMGHRDEEGRLVIGLGTKGCWNCGSTTTETNHDGTVVIIRPSVDCCAPALMRQLTGRDDEIRTQMKRVTDELARQDELRHTILLSKYPREQEALAEQLARSEAAQERLLADVHAHVARLKEERTQVRRKLRDLGHEPKSLPTPEPATYTLEELLRPPEE